MRPSADTIANGWAKGSRRRVANSGWSRRATDVVDVPEGGRRQIPRRGLQHREHQIAVAVPEVVELDARRGPVEASERDRRRLPRQRGEQRREQRRGHEVDHGQPEGSLGLGRRELVHVRQRPHALEHLADRLDQRLGARGQHHEVAAHEQLVVEPGPEALEGVAGRRLGHGEATTRAARASGRCAAPRREARRGAGRGRALSTRCSRPPCYHRAAWSRSWPGFPLLASWHGPVHTSSQTRHRPASRRDDAHGRGFRWAKPRRGRMDEWARLLHNRGDGSPAERRS